MRAWLLILKWERGKRCEGVFERGFSNCEITVNHFRWVGDLTNQLLNLCAYLLGDIIKKKERIMIFFIMI